LKVLNLELKADGDVRNNSFLGKKGNPPKMIPRFESGNFSLIFRFIPLFWPLNQYFAIIYLDDFLKEAILKKNRRCFDQRLPNPFQRCALARQNMEAFKCHFYSICCENVKYGQNDTFSHVQNDKN
jgi:hypothetical protein